GAHAVAVVPAGETFDRAAGFVARGGRHWCTQRGAARRRRRSRIHAVVLYFAAVATVVIAANPYEAELCRKALGETGLQVQVAEGGDGLLDLIVSARPLAVVIADGLFCGDMQDLLREVREKHSNMPVFLIAERGGDVPDEAAANWLGARRLFFRPVEVEKFADAVEKLAVEAELASEVAE